MVSIFSVWLGRETLEKREIFWLQLCNWLTIAHQVTRSEWTDFGEKERMQDEMREQILLQPRFTDSLDLSVNHHQIWNILQLLPFFHPNSATWVLWVKERSFLEWCCWYFVCCERKESPPNMPILFLSYKPDNHSESYSSTMKKGEPTKSNFTQRERWGASDDHWSFSGWSQDLFLLSFLSHFISSDYA